MWDEKKETGNALYSLIAGELYGKIESGEYAAGDRLPTEAALAKEKGVSVGTVRKAYDKLRRRGCIYKVRGGGSYVQGGESPESRSTPQELVERTIETLTDTGIPMSRIFLLLRKQMESVFRSDRKVKLALVDCNSETLHHVMLDLKKKTGLEVEPYLLHDLFSGESMISPRCIMTLVAEKHYNDFIRYADSMHLWTEKVALRESRKTIAKLAVLPDRQDVCILYRSREFLESVQFTMKVMGKKGRLKCVNEQQIGLEQERLARESLSFIIPPDYMDYSSNLAFQLIGRAKKMGCTVIPFEFEIDRGSLLHLKQILENLKEDDHEEEGLEEGI